MKKVDMSSEAVTTRLKRVSQLRRLCLTLGAAKVASGEAKNEESQKAAETISSSPERVGK